MATKIQVRMNENGDDPDERRALEVYDRWIEAGNSPRRIIALALLALEGISPTDPTGGLAMADSLQSALDRIERLASNLQFGILPEQRQEAQEIGAELDETLKQAVIKGFRPAKRKGN